MLAKYCLISSINLQMNQLLIFHLFLISVVDAQSLSGPDVPSQDTVSKFQPSLAVVITILAVVFSLTICLLLSAKFCNRGLAPVHRNDPRIMNGFNTPSSRFSGIDKTVIESLPFFRFSSLKGSKNSLECAVCLSKFEETELLRLLPNCKHAFHINCVDQWLEKHSSCPLCRHKVNADDPTIFTYSNSMRQDSDIELFVQREEDDHLGSSRFNIGSSFRKIFHKVNHRIVVSEHIMLNNRWSNVSSSDLLFLNSEMISDITSNRFSHMDSNSGRDEETMKIKEELNRKMMSESKIMRIDNGTSNFVNNKERRSISEITGLSRFRDLRVKNAIGESCSSSSLENNVNEERKRELWLPIAKRTIQWFAHTEETFQQSQKSIKQQLHV